MTQIKQIIQSGAEKKMTERELLSVEIARWKGSPKRRAMLDGFRYYRGEHDILRRNRTAIGADGKTELLPHLPNHRVVDNQYGQMVNQKVNYLLGRKCFLSTENSRYLKKLNRILGEFQPVLHLLGEQAMNGGISWLYPYMEKGELRFRVFPGYEILPFWADSAHTSLDMAVRVYEQEWYDGKTLKIMECAEVYRKDGVGLYTLEKDGLVPQVPCRNPYILCPDGEKPLYCNWGRIPLIPFRCNSSELPLLSRVKGLQDGINEMLSDFENHMQEDARNTVLILKNYDGTNLQEFRRNLAAYGVVKVKTVDGAQGGVEALRVEVNGEQYKLILELLRKALCRNAMGYDSRDERMGGSPNQMSIKSMYTDIDLDANGMETEFSDSFSKLLWFVNRYLCGTGQGDYHNVPVTLTLNRDMLQNESEIMDMLYKGGLKLSNRTLIEQVPWTNDAAGELRRLHEETAEVGLEDDQ